MCVCVCESVRPSVCLCGREGGEESVWENEGMIRMNTNASTRQNGLI